MTTVTKEKNWGTSDVINVQTEEGNLYISFEKNLNLYFSYLGNSMEDEKDTYSFVINNENGFLYQSFDDLYDAVISQKPFKNSEILYQDYGYSHLGFEHMLIKNGVIEWHSDDEEYDKASVLYIERQDDAYIVTFKKGKSDEFDRSSYKVCLKNGGSQYDPYNVTFMIMYNSLKDHDFELDKFLEKGKVRAR